MRKAEVLMHGKTAGWLSEDANGYHYVYDTNYLDSGTPEPVSFTLPPQEEPFTSQVLFPFFDGLIPEGWLLDIAQKNWKLNPRDRMGLLLSCCKDCIGCNYRLQSKVIKCYGGSCELQKRCEEHLVFKNISGYL